jgi:hypothetical protein
MLLLLLLLFFAVCLLSFHTKHICLRELTCIHKFAAAAAATAAAAAAACEAALTIVSMYNLYLMLANRLAYPLRVLEAAVVELWVTSNLLVH